MEPFRELLASALQRARGSKSLKKPLNETEEILKHKASRLLSDHEEFAEKTLGVSGLKLDTSDVSLDKMYKRVSLSVEFDGNNLPLSKIGTGHQSALIIHLFRQLGNEYYDGDTLFLFEEPANHLHPTTTRSIGSDLSDISNTSQVFISTHSPILINYFGFDRLIPLKIDKNKNTIKREPKSSELKDGELRSLFNHHGLKLTEPFLSKRVIVVEGNSDLSIISRLIYRKLGSTPDQADILVVPVGGKHHVVEVSSYLERLDVDWKAVFGWDAVINGEKRVTISELQDENIRRGKGAVQLLKKLLNDTNRANGFEGQLDEIYDELDGNAPKTTLYKDSKIHLFLEKDNHLESINREDKSKLIGGLDSKHVTKYQPILNKYNAWVWRNDIESAILYKDKSYEIAEDSLIESGEISTRVPRSANWKQRIHNRVHNIGNPITLRKLVDDLDREGMFSRTQVNKAIGWILEDLELP